MKVSDLDPLRDPEMIVVAESLEDEGWTVVTKTSGRSDMIDAWRDDPKPVKITVRMRPPFYVVGIWSSQTAIRNPVLFEDGRDLAATIGRALRKKAWIDRFMAGLGRRAVVSRSRVSVGRIDFTLFDNPETVTVMPGIGDMRIEDTEVFSYDDAGADEAARKFRDYVPVGD